MKEPVSLTDLNQHYAYWSAFRPEEIVYDLDTGKLTIPLYRWRSNAGAIKKIGWFRYQSTFRLFRDNLHLLSIKNFDFNDEQSSGDTYYVQDFSYSQELQAFRINCDIPVPLTILMEEWSVALEASQQAIGSYIEKETYIGPFVFSHRKILMEE